MMNIRASEDRGVADFGWLNSRHTFSFGHYFNPDHMGFGPLRVINDDRVSPGGGFPTHGHRDMEIISYVLDGALEHKDTIGNASIIRPGDVQRMSAGTGIRHSEFNASKTEAVHFLQIWIMPERDNLAPSYEQIRFSNAEKQAKLRLVGSRDGREGSVVIHQDVSLYATLLTKGESVIHKPREGRLTWIHVAAGEGAVNNIPVKAGDGIAFEGADAITLASDKTMEFLLFDMTDRHYD